MREDITQFTVRLYSPDGVGSPVIDYVEELEKNNFQMAIKATHAISQLPNKIYLGSDIKPIRSGKYKFWELRVKSGSNICRFFFTIENPSVIVLFGFTKKTQKTEKRHLNKGTQYFLDYQEHRRTIPFQIE